MTEAPAFTLFGTSHLVTLTVVTGIVVAAAWGGRQRRIPLALPLALFLLAQELVKLWLFVAVYDQRWLASLPLDLCRLNALLCAWMLIRRSYRTFEVSYFWAMAGSTSALLTPDLQAGFPDPRYLAFFVGHASGIVAVVYAIFGFGFRPRLRSLGFALAITALYALLIAALNPLLDTNYLFLQRKPASPSVLDLFGPWPYYLIGLMGVAAVACAACYLPFALSRAGSRRHA